MSFDSTPPSIPSQQASPVRNRLATRLLFVLLPCLVALGLYLVTTSEPASKKAHASQPQDEKASRERQPPEGEKEPEKERDLPLRRKVKAPELEGGIGWLNSAGPLRLKDLRGKIVVLDFWTLCCINCMHVLPDLARLEKKYPNDLVVIGVHTAKFDNEKDPESIRKAILRYEIAHPVVNDANHAIWQTYGVESWPTLFVLDTEGNARLATSGEGNYTLLDRAISTLIKEAKENKTLDEKPRKFELARFQETGASPLFFPGKISVDAPGNRLFIADSTHHRIVITDLQGKKIAVAGEGQPGQVDGSFSQARFEDPQGMALQGETLYVADRKNHQIRALDLKSQTVRTIAGTGKQGHDRDNGGPSLKTGLNSPWALLIQGDKMYIAMAGLHQIWVMDLNKQEVAPFAGNGRETLRDGTLEASCFAQPSGLASDGKNLYVADSETSSIRMISPENNEVKTIVGMGLFDFGDIDGKGDKVRLQHALGLTWVDGKLYVADTYNSKIKVIDPEQRTCKTFLGSEPEGWLGTPLLHEPGGISAADGKLYLADTNAHRIRVVDIKTKTISTLKLDGVEAPKQ